MNCPVCGSKTAITETVTDGDRNLRIRRCARCKEQFVTVEEQSTNPEDRIYLRRLRYEQRYNRRWSPGQMTANYNGIDNNHIDDDYY